MDWITQGMAMLKLGLCGLPLGLSLYAAEEMAVRRDCPSLAAAWRLGARAVLALAALCLLAQALALAFG